MENIEVLEYKNFHLFYKNLYTRLFELINNIIDEKHYNINNIKYSVQDFLDSYSYYIISKNMITKKDYQENNKTIYKELEEFSKFTDSLDKFPSENYIKSYTELSKNNYDLNKLSSNSYKLILREYYLFYNEILIKLNHFVEIASINGFLPNIKSRNALKIIGFAQYDLFFIELENLKLKMSEITKTININNIFKSRRCVLSVLIIFSPYFTKIDIYKDLVKKLDFKFLNNDDDLNELRKLTSYQTINDMGTDTKNKFYSDILNPLYETIRLIKRYISYEFGERDINPRINRKYAYDPSDV